MTGLAHIGEYHVETVPGGFDVDGALGTAPIEGGNRAQELRDEVRRLVLAQAAVPHRITEQHGPDFVLETRRCGRGRFRHRHPLRGEPGHANLLDRDPLLLPELDERCAGAGARVRPFFADRESAKLGLEHPGAQRGHPGKDQIRVIERGGAAPRGMIAGDRHAARGSEHPLESGVPTVRRSVDADTAQLLRRKRQHDVGLDALLLQGLETQNVGGRACRAIGRERPRPCQTPPDGCRDRLECCRRVRPIGRHRAGDVSRVHEHRRNS